jgi:hypothetical protein
VLASPTQPRMSFRDRFEFATYLEDPPVRLGLVAPTGEPEWALDVPEMLFARAKLAAAAYQLPLLPGIKIQKQTRLDGDSCESLLQEIEFLQAVLQDPLMDAILAPIEQIILRCIHSEGKLQLILEGLEGPE